MLPIFRLCGFCTKHKASLSGFLKLTGALAPNPRLFHCVFHAWLH
jgi:hypothetical protein